MGSVVARDYDPTLGRFTTIDPVLDPTAPQQSNGYSYGWNNPLKNADPSGLEPHDAGCNILCSEGLNGSAQSAAPSAPSAGGGSVIPTGGVAALFAGGGGMAGVSMNQQAGVNAFFAAQPQSPPVSHDPGPNFGWTMLTSAADSFGTVVYEYGGGPAISRCVNQRWSLAGGSGGLACLQADAQIAADAIPFLKGASVAEGATTNVIVDTNAVFNKPGVLAALRPGETPVVTQTTRAELANLAAAGRMKPPAFAGELATVPDVMDVNLRISLRGQIASMRAGQPGLFGDGAIGATAIRTGSPVITSDKNFTAALEMLGIEVRKP